MKNASRLILIVSIAAAALAFSALVAWLQVRHEAASASPAYVAENFGGPFSLTDHTGRAVTQKDFAGTYRLIYFGFTFCPAICPTELAKITEALNAIGPDADKITPLFITVDPERDTVAVLKQYVGLFHPRLTGLTGTPDQIREAAKNYKIYYAKVQDPALTDYTIDHSSFIYFIDPRDNLLNVFRMDDDAAKMAAAIDAALP